MSETLDAMRHRIGTVRDLGEVVRTMKALAASNIAQFDRAARASAESFDLVRLGLSTCLERAPTIADTSRARRDGIVTFGSDQGLVGLFNESLASSIAERDDAVNARIWVIGERLRGRLEDHTLEVKASLPLPTAVSAISPLIGRLLTQVEAAFAATEIGSLFVIHNRPLDGAGYEVRVHRLLPFDQAWRDDILELRWPTDILPEAINPDGTTLHALVREYLFLSLFQACAESLAAENMCRVLAMQLAQKNIGELLDDLRQTYNRTRKDAIDAELFDVVFGFHALERRGRSAVSSDQ